MHREKLMPPRTRKWLAALAGLWLILTVGCTLAHRHVHEGTVRPNGRTGELDGFCKQVTNTAQVVNAPAWMVAWFVFHRYESYRVAAVVNAFGFAFWLGAAAVVLEARRRYRAPTINEPIEHSFPALSALSRRAFLTDSVLVTGVACSGATGVYSSFVTPWSLEVTKYRVPIADLPRSLDGLRIVQLTDTHLGPRVPASFIEQTVEAARALKPDLFVLTGDYVHTGTRYIESAAALFKPLTEPRAGLIGVIGILGNHDHYANADRMTAALLSAGVRMLDNQSMFVDARTRALSSVPAGEALCVAGVGDFLEGIVDISAALRAVPANMPRLVLSHNPDVAETLAARSHRIDLMLAGHTHGGQVRLPFIGSPIVPSEYGQKYAYGMVRGPTCPVLISAGVGMSVLPLRLGVPPEIVEITLACV